MLKKKINNAVMGLEGRRLEQTGECWISFWWKNLSLPGATWEHISADLPGMEETDVSWEIFNKI